MENDIEIWEMAKMFGKLLRIMGMDYVFEKRLFYVGNGFRI